jgi:glycine cleavage system H protein
VVEVNEAIVANPELVNQDPEGNAWFIKIRIANPRELDQLMPEHAYKDYLETVA